MSVCDRSETGKDEFRRHRHRSRVRGPHREPIDAAKQLAEARKCDWTCDEPVAEGVSRSVSDWLNTLRQLLLIAPDGDESALSTRKNRIMTTTATMPRYPRQPTGGSSSIFANNL